jgi:hypothetical protein
MRDTVTAYHIMTKELLSFTALSCFSRIGTRRPRLALALFSSLFAALTAAFTALATKELVIHVLDCLDAGHEGFLVDCAHHTVRKGLGVHVRVRQVAGT